VREREKIPAPSGISNNGEGEKTPFLLGERCYELAKRGLSREGLGRSANEKDNRHSGRVLPKGHYPLSRNPLKPNGTKPATRRKKEEGSTLRLPTNKPTRKEHFPITCFVAQPLEQDEKKKSQS